MQPLRGAMGTLAVLAALAGALFGAVRGFHFLLDGFPLLLAASVRDGVVWALLALAVLALGFLLANRLLRDGWGEPSAIWLATFLAGVPVLAVAGYQANWAWGIRPSELLTGYALTRNLGLLAAGFLLLAGTAMLLVRVVIDEAVPARPWRVPVAVALLALLFHGGLAILFRQPATGAPAPPILVLLVDALRMDESGVYGNPRPTTPAIDALARDGVVFRQAISQSTFTKSSIASLFTGRNPFEHGLYWGTTQTAEGAITSDVLVDEETTLAELLREKGYLTTAWVQNGHLRGEMGFAQGFVDYQDSQGNASRIVRRFSDFLAGPGRRYGFFSYLHFIDLHDPYRPRPPYDALFGPTADAYADIDLAEWGRYLDQVRKGERQLTPEALAVFRRLYDGQLRYVDDEIGRLLARMKELGLYDKTLIVLTADHGDGFGEHGFISHSTTPYEELVRVPLIVKLPEGKERGRVVDEQVRLIDVMPTLLAAARIRPPRETSGCSLLPLLASPGGAGGGSGERPAGCEVAITEIAEEGAAPDVAVRAGGFKYIHHEKRPGELYDLTADPGEMINLAPQGGAVYEDLHRRALAVIAHRKQLSGRRTQLDERTLRELKALGYLK